MHRIVWAALCAAGLVLACKDNRKEPERSLKPVIEKVERQPVVGHAPFDIYMLDADGKEWLVTDHRLIADVQRKLDARGFEVTVDGKADVETATALRRFQQKRDLDQSGKVDRATARALGLDWDRFLAQKAKQQH